MPQLNRKLIFRLLGLLVSVGCLGYFALSAAAAFKAANAHLELRSALVAVLSALPPYAIGYIAFAWIWHLLLTGMGVRSHLRDTAGIFFTSQFGKYLPGNVGHHAGRIYLAHRAGYATAPVAASMILEVMLIVGAALVLSLPLAYLLANHLPAISGRGWVAGTLIFAVTAYAVAIMVSRQHFAEMWARFSSKLSLPAIPKIAATLVVGFLLAMAAISLCALSLAMLGNADWSSLAPKLPHVIALFSAAWIAGLLTPGAPAGLGIREVILMKGLTASFGATDAVTATILFRLLTVMADVVALGAGTVLLRSSRPNSAPNP